MESRVLFTWLERESKRAAYSEAISQSFRVIICLHDQSSFHIYFSVETKLQENSENKERTSEQHFVKKLFRPLR